MAEATVQAPSTGTAFFRRQRESVTEVGLRKATGQMLRPHLHAPIPGILVRLGFTGYDHDSLLPRCNRTEMTSDRERQDVPRGWGSTQSALTASAANSACRSHNARQGRRRSLVILSLLLHRLPGRRDR